MPPRLEYEPIKVNITSAAEAKQIIIDPARLFFVYDSGVEREFEISASEVGLFFDMACASIVQSVDDLTPLSIVDRRIPEVDTYIRSSSPDVSARYQNSMWILIRESFSPKKATLIRDHIISHTLRTIAPLLSPAMPDSFVRADSATRRLLQESLYFRRALLNAAGNFFRTFPGSL